MPRPAAPSKRTRTKSKPLPAKSKAQPKAKRAAAPAPAYLEASDFRRYLVEKSVLIAPGDLDTVVAQHDHVVAKIARDCGEHELLRRQLHLALELVENHERGRIPQIPYYTVSVLTAALLYFMNPMDVIPDFIKGVGTSDDALLLEIAVEMVWPGIERYCTSMGTSLDGLRGTVTHVTSSSR